MVGAASGLVIEVNASRGSGDLLDKDAAGTDAGIQVSWTATAVPTIFTSQGFSSRLKIDVSEVYRLPTHFPDSLMPSTALLSLSVGTFLHSALSMHRQSSMVASRHVLDSMSANDISKKFKSQ